ncbi:MAG: sulfurtransferase TusA family protein [Rhodospirillales bacterium]|nr:sulfurtransferase TusA family protein [Rhodospirillales bacterium]
MQESNKGNKSKESVDVELDFYLDITKEICPMTFVKTKLMLEKMSPGQLLQVQLKGAEPLKNVPLSVKEHGHEVISLTNEEGGEDPEVVHRLIVRRK